MSLSLSGASGRGHNAPTGQFNLVVDTPHPGIRLVRVTGALGSGSAARLLRVLDAQLMLVRSGHRRLDAVIVDISGLEALDRGGPQALEHGRYACAQLDVQFLLAGYPDGLHSAPMSVHHRLRGLRIVPTVDAALQTLLGSAPGASDNKGDQPLTSGDDLAGQAP